MVNMTSREGIAPLTIGTCRTIAAFHHPIDAFGPTLALASLVLGGAA